METYINKNNATVKLLLHYNEIFDAINSETPSLSDILKSIIFDEKNLNKFNYNREYGDDLFINLKPNQIKKMHSLLNKNKKNITLNFLKNSFLNKNNKIENIKINEIEKLENTTYLLLNIEFKNNIIENKVIEKINDYISFLEKNKIIIDNYDIELTYSSNMCVILNGELKNSFYKMQSFFESLEKTQVNINASKNKEDVIIRKYQLMETNKNG
tara:strand:- start:40318 stop:40959 length:642 start_codon:yes stop_codon:yes gene_type:complete